MDEEVKSSEGTSYDFGARMYDPRLGKFLSLDPDAGLYPFMSAYCFAANSVIRFVDINGEGPSNGPVVKTLPKVVHYYNMVLRNGEYVAEYHHSSTILVIRSGKATARNSVTGKTVNLSVGDHGAPSNGVTTNVYTYWDVNGHMLSQVVVSKEVAGGVYQAGTTVEGNHVSAFEYSTPVVQEVSSKENVHMALDVVGLLPVVGEAFDGLNAGFYILEGDYVNAGFSAVATIPFAGWAATSGKWAKNVLKFSDNAFHTVSGLVFKTGSKQGNRLSHVLEHTTNDLSKEFHGVFDSNEQVISLVDEAWSIAQKGGEDVIKTTESGRDIFIVNMNRRIGFQGGAKGSGESLNKIKIVVESGTSNVITIFPN